MKRGVSLLVCIYLSVLCLSAQNTRFEDYSVLLSPEKVYIQTDREVYNIGDTIWFRGYLENVSYLAKYAECNYIYVELVSAKWEKNAYKKVSEERFSIHTRRIRRRGRSLRQRDAGIQQNVGRKRYDEQYRQDDDPCFFHEHTST